MPGVAQIHMCVYVLCAYLCYSWWWYSGVTPGDALRITSGSAWGFMWYSELNLGM